MIRLHAHPTPSPVSKLDQRHTGILRKRGNMLMGEGGRATPFPPLPWSRIIRPQESLALHKSFNPFWYTSTWKYLARGTLEYNLLLPTSVIFFSLSFFSGVNASEFAETVHPAHCHHILTGIRISVRLDNPHQPIITREIRCNQPDIVVGKFYAANQNAGPRRREPIRTIRKKHCHLCRLNFK
jgi:hypothetical protein